MQILNLSLFVSGYQKELKLPLVETFQETTCLQYPGILDVFLLDVKPQKMFIIIYVISFTKRRRLLDPVTRTF